VRSSGIDVAGAQIKRRRLGDVGAMYNSLCYALYNRFQWFIAKRVAALVKVYNAHQYFRCLI